MPTVFGFVQAACRQPDRIHGRDRHVPRRARLAKLECTVGRHARDRVGGRCGGGIQLSDRTENRCGDGAYTCSSAASRRIDQHPDAGVFRRGGGGWPVPAECIRQSAHDVADTGHVRRLCGDLYSRAETGYAAEHCHWRRVRRDAAGTWLGRGNGRNPS